MAHERTSTIDNHEASALAGERARLVRLCAQMTGDVAVAEDLAQETLLEAHRQADRLRNPHARSAWLAGIARNMCRRWARTRSREIAHFAHRSGEEGVRLDDWLVDDLDLELEIEREELAKLLDRAMALLPAETRLALIHRYVDDEPQALVAQRLGLSQGAVAMRLSRGKFALRRILATELHDDAIALGLGAASADPWQPTRVWCTMCGIERLVGHFDPVNGELMLRCPGCFPTYGLYQVRAEEPGLFAGVQGVLSAYRRALAASHTYYRQAFAENVAKCPACGGRAIVHRRLPERELPRLREARGAHVRCCECDATFHVSLGGLILALPEARAFWRKHHRIRALPECEIEIGGRTALVSRIESVTDAARLDVVTDTETLLTLETYVDGIPFPPA